MQYTPQGDISLTGRYTLSGGIMKYSLPIIPLKEFQINNGSYVDWRGEPDESDAEPESDGAYARFGSRW